MPENLSVREAAQELNVTPQTVRAYIHNGALTAARLPSGYLRIPRWSIQQILASSVAQKSAVVRG